MFRHNKLNHRNLLSTLASCAVLPLALSACSSSGPSQSDAIMAGTLGEETNSICFNRNIRSWHEFDRQSIILEARNDEFYKVDLVGACDARNSFLQVQIESRSGICLGPGDEITFDRDIGGGPCSVSEIHRWHPAVTMQ